MILTLFFWRSVTGTNGKVNVWMNGPGLKRAVVVDPEEEEEEGFPTCPCSPPQNVYGVRTRSAAALAIDRFGS